MKQGIKIILLISLLLLFGIMFGLTIRLISTGIINQRVSYSELFIHNWILSNWNGAIENLTFDKNAGGYSCYYERAGEEGIRHLDVYFYPSNPWN